MVHRGAASTMMSSRRQQVGGGDPRLTVCVYLSALSCCGLLSELCTTSQSPGFG